MKDHLVVPFKPQVGKKIGFGTTVVANQVQEVITDYAFQGWEFVSIESITTTVQGNQGCFGFGATPNTTTFVQVIIFQK